MNPSTSLSYSPIDQLATLVERPTRSRHKLIEFNASEPTLRQGFTVAHELGHSTREEKLPANIKVDALPNRWQATTRC
ncbi:ImmA/IrrE family metallo-endopeptidase [Mycetohabitans rhizoxinica]|uniref:ImmA/IrrE family metallo-endopeptidase n=1 Tax=Mycetohabitans rhizoxinica TaxID=412963 RepID=UPI003BAF5683